MRNCLFCKIVEGISPCFKIFEDAKFLGFLDINPRTRGHSLLISKGHYQWVYQVPEFKQYWYNVLKITKAMQKVLQPKFITYVTHGLEIPHAHIHILPRQTETEFMPAAKNISRSEMVEIAAKIFQTVKG